MPSPLSPSKIPFFFDAACTECYDVYICMQRLNECAYARLMHKRGYHSRLLRLPLLPLPRALTHSLSLCLLQGIYYSILIAHRISTDTIHLRGKSTSLRRRRPHIKLVQEVHHGPLPRVGGPRTIIVIVVVVVIVIVVVLVVVAAVASLPCSFLRLGIRQPEHDVSVGGREEVEPRVPRHHRGLLRLRRVDRVRRV